MMENPARNGFPGKCPRHRALAYGISEGVQTAGEARADMPTVRERLNAFMKRRNVTRSQLAAALSTSVKTMDGWLYEGHTPPAVMISMLDLIEGSPRVRARLGLSCRRKLPRGRPFQPGHPYRFNDPRRLQAIAEACTRREKSSG